MQAKGMQAKQWAQQWAQCKHSKRAASHVDWVISLAIFLLFVTWFFIFLLPTFTTTQRLEPLLDAAEAGFEQSYWTVSRLPLVIQHNFTADNAPVIGPYIGGNFSFLDGRNFYNESDEIYFTANVTAASVGKNLLYMIDSINQTELPHAMIANANYTTLLDRNFTVYFANGSISRMTYAGLESIKGTTYYIAGLNSTAQAFNHTNGKVVSITRSWFDSFFMKTIVFEKNSKAILIFNASGTTQQKNTTISMELYNYPLYWSDNFHKGAVNYTPGACVNYTSDKIVFYNTEQALLFMSAKPMSIAFCSLNTTLYLNLTIDTTDTTSKMVIAPHALPYNETANYYEMPIMNLGLAEQIKGLSKSKLLEFQQKSYEAIKKSWKYPSTADFKVKVYNDTTLADISAFGMEPDNATDVAVREKTDYIVDEYAQKAKVKVNIRVWQ